MEPRNRHPAFAFNNHLILILNCFRNVTILIRTFIIYYYYHLLPQAPQNTSFELLTTVCMYMYIHVYFNTVQYSTVQYSQYVVM